MVKVKHADIPLPTAMANLPLTPNGYRKPWFVKGNDLRVTNQEKYIKCMTGHTCWICGNTNKKAKVFIHDVRSALTGRSIEPPSHLECTLYALRVCPFLLLPQFKQRPDTLPEYLRENGSKALSHENPGVYVMTSVKKFKYGTVNNGAATRYANWLHKDVLCQSLWSEGKSIHENKTGSLDKPELAKMLAIYG